MARINSYTKITGAPADSDCFIIDSTQGTAGTRIVLWSVLKSVLTGIFAPKAHKHPGSDITSAVANANAATNDSVGQNIASTYVKELTVNGRTITVKRGNNTTYTFQTQDTTYLAATDNSDGLLSARNHHILTWMYKQYIELVDIVNHNGVPSLHLTNGSVVSDKRDIYLDAANNNRSGIMAASDWQLLHSLKTIDRAVELPSDTDLNNIKDPGYYYMSWAVSGSIKNKPVSYETVGILLVLPLVGTYELDQVYITGIGANNRKGRETIFVRHYGGGQGAIWNSWTDITAYQSATQSVDGLMSSADKRKLDGLSGDYASAIGLATSSKDGLMPKADKAKLDAIGSIPNSTIDGFFRI